MTEGEAIALISMLGTVLAALITTAGLLLRSIRRRTDAIRYEITNDHTAPLRDDMDSKHATQMSMLRGVVRDVGGMRDDIRQLRRDLSHTADRVDEIERTRPPLTKGTT
ncbi:MAG TPA: hypothetical protein VN133_10015 [Humibacter sp.]|nr:hypothetical protein [Humibacter sp.]